MLKKVLFPLICLFVLLFALATVACGGGGGVTVGGSSVKANVTVNTPPAGEVEGASVNNDYDAQEDGNWQQTQSLNVTVAGTEVPVVAVESEGNSPAAFDFDISVNADVEK